MRKFSIALVNPNANARTTCMMVEIAREAAVQIPNAPRLSIAGHTAASGPQMIIDTDALARSAIEVEAITRSLAGTAADKPDALIVAAYGDPGLETAQEHFPGRAFGIGTESMMAAATGRRRFAVATTTPGLAPAIDARARRLGLASVYGGVFLTRTPPLELAADPDRQQEELADAVANAIRVGGAEAVIIGGGPLARAARHLASSFEVPLIEPVPAAVIAAAEALG